MCDCTIARYSSNSVVFHNIQSRSYKSDPLESALRFLLFKSYTDVFDQNAARSYSVKIDNSSIERVEEFKYLGKNLNK